MNRPLPTLLLLLACLSGGCAATVGQPAPDFSHADLDGKTHTLSALRGEAVLLDFWAVW